MIADQQHSISLFVGAHNSIEIDKLLCLRFFLKVLFATRFDHQRRICKMDGNLPVRNQ